MSMNTIHLKKGPEHRVALPSYAGAYVIGVMAVYLERKPRWLHRTMMRWCFGWEWKDEA